MCCQVVVVKASIDPTFPKVKLLWRYGDTVMITASETSFTYHGHSVIAHTQQSEQSPADHVTTYRRGKNMKTCTNGT